MSTQRKKTSRASTSASPEQASAKDAHREQAVKLLEQMANGDLTGTLEMASNSDDPLLSAVRRLSDFLHELLGDLLVRGTLTEKSSSTMHLTAKSVRDNASHIRHSLDKELASTEEMGQNMNSVSASAEELSANMQSIAGAARQGNENVDSIARSISELTTASREIAENTARATTISKEAMENVAAAFALVRDLTTAAKEIDVVTAAISEISDQTKLLALNATIEAARAGEMGKGFAVVAREVKDLASQTNTATKDIQSKIAIIHSVTSRTVESMTTIDRVMRSVNEAITFIAAAAEEQSVTTTDIAQNVVKATERIKEMSDNVGEGATAVQDVSRSILGATTIANSVAQSIRALGGSAIDVRDHSVVSYAQALEVANHATGVTRRLRGVRLPDRLTSQASEVPLEFCRFSRDFDVGVQGINEDHRRIFEYINTLHARIKDRVDPRQLTSVFKDLANFTRDHFSREEEAMTRTAYPDIARHRQIHTKLLAQVGETTRALEAGHEVDMIEVLGFLGSWLINHILGVDKGYSPFMHAAGIR